MKRCYKCKKNKPLDDFPVNRKRADGHGSMCKGCKKSYNATYYVDTKKRYSKPSYCGLVGAQPGIF